LDHQVGLRKYLFDNYTDTAGLSMFSGPTGQALKTLDPVGSYLLILYCKASAKWAFSIISELSRSAIVRASLIVL